MLQNVEKAGIKQEGILESLMDIFYMVEVLIGCNAIVWLVGKPKSLH